MTLTPSAKKLRRGIRDPHCTLCPLHSEAQYICLTGDGPVPCRVMLVGEAPGLREEEESKPFVGRAGQYLDEVLEKCGLPRAKVFISNAVKCRPPGNATPKTAEIKACNDFLVEEVKAVNPDYILALGNPALGALTSRRAGITKLTGTWLTSKTVFGNRRVMACLHPSAVLRREFLKSKFEFAIKQFATIAQNKTSKIKTDYKLVTTKKLFDEAMSDIMSADIVSWDIENSKGFNPHNGGDILCIGFSTRPGKSWVFPYKHPQMKLKNPAKILRAVKEIVEAEKPRKVAQNGQYERKWMLRHGINPRMDFDTKIAAYLLDENGPTGLKPLARALCEAPVWDEGIDWEKGIPPFKILWPYNAADADYTLRLYHILSKRINAIPQLARFMKFLMLPAADMLADVEFRGIALDRDRLNERSKEAEAGKFRTAKKLHSYLPKKKLTKNRKGQLCIDDEDFGVMKVNWNSTKFLGWFLYKHLGLPLIELTKTGKAGTREAVLLQIKSKHSAVATLLTYREWQGRDSKFLTPWIDRAFDYGKNGLLLYPTYNLTKTDAGAGTETGRLSGDMQQVPREGFIRNIITARPGWRFGEADLSQIELRIAAWLADEDTMLKAFREDKDIHLETAADVSGLDPSEVDKPTRKKAKAINFGFLYGMWPKKFQLYAREKFDIEITIQEAREYRNKYFNKYPRLLEWHDDVRRRVAVSGYVKSPMGRRRRLPHIHSMDRKLKEQAERQAINSPPQAMGSDLCLFGAVLIRPQLSTKIYNEVGFMHDAILFEYKESHRKEVRSVIKQTLEHLPTKRYFGFEIPVPIKVNIDMSTHWKGIEEK